MFTFFFTSIDNAQTMQSSLDALVAFKIILVIFFIFSCLTGLCNLIFYLVVKYSPDLSFRFLVPRFSSGGKNVTFFVKDDLGQPLNFSRLTIFQKEKVRKIYYLQKSKLSIYLPKGEFQAIIKKFGHASSQTNAFVVGREKLDFNLVLKRAQEVTPAEGIAEFEKTVMILDIILALISVIFLVRYYTSMTVYLQIVIIAIAVFSAYLTSRFYEISRAVRLVNFKGRPLANKKVEIANGSDLIDKFTTDKEGILHIMLSPGTYKLTPEDYSPRSVRINETCLGYFKVKF